MNPKERFLNACQRKTVDRPPVWMMRQAGRYLPEYRALKEKHQTKVMMQTPELATEITLQPVHLIGVDAAILYSDILMIPDALGMGLRFATLDGPVFDFAIQNDEALSQLNPHNLNQRLSYVFKAIQLCVKQLPSDFPLLGFAGAPFTVACYMVAGKGEKGFKSVFDLMEKEPQTLKKLLELLAEATLSYLIEQKNAGVVCVQMFDTWAGLLTKEQYNAWAKPYSEFVLNGLKDQGILNIHFIKNGAHLFDELTQMNSNVLGLDSSYSLSEAFKTKGDCYAFQGNFDPEWLKTDESTIEKKLKEMLANVPDLKKGYIINLGHGIDKETPVAHARYFVKRAQELGSACP